MLEGVAHERSAQTRLALDRLYAWITGESWLRALRRSLVTQLSVDRAQVAFLGY